MKPFFRRNTLCIARKNGAQQAEKTRCLGVLTVFRQTLNIQNFICRLLPANSASFFTTQTIDIEPIFLAEAVFLFT